MWVFFKASLVAQRLKHLPPMWKTWARSLGQEDPLEKEMATHSSILAWRIPWMEEPDRLWSTGSQRVGHNWAISLISLTHLVLKKNSNIMLCMTFEKEPGHCLNLQYGFSPLLPCLYISSLIHNCLNLAFGTQRRSWMLNEAYFLQTRDWGTENLLGSRAPQGSMWFQYKIRIIYNKI